MVKVKQSESDLQLILTDIPGTPGMFWGDHSAYVGSFIPPGWLVKLVGKGRAFNLMGVVSALRLLARRRHHLGVVTDGGASGLLFAALQFLVPWGRKPHVMIDCLWYESPGRLAMGIKRLVRQIAARSGTRFVVWASHEVDDFARAFGIPRESLVYVPHYYSLDGYEYTIRDDGYLFAGGNGDRDYRTLIEAVRPLEIPTWIATTNHEALRGIEIPAHVKVEGTTHEGFRQAMAGARLVVIAMQDGLLHSGGQQTCLNAMMMEKPTIAVGRKWAVDLIDDQVDGLIVDFGDIESLRTSIKRVMDQRHEAMEMGRRARIKAGGLHSRNAMERIYELASQPARKTLDNESVRPVRNRHMETRRKRYVLSSVSFRLREFMRFSYPFGLAASLGLQYIASRRRSPHGDHLPYLCRAARCCPGQLRRRGLEDRLRSEAARLDPDSVRWESLTPGDTRSTTIHKAIILKAPVSDGEKGVLYVSFENQWIKMLRSGRAEEIARRYDLVLGPTWSPAHDPSLMMAARVWPGCFITLVNNLDDIETMRNLSPKIEPVPLMMSSWTNPAIYEPYVGRDKTIDILMIASFSQYKRHWLFFETLRKLPRSLRVVLIGRPIGQRTEDALRKEAALFGVEDRFELWNNATDEQIASAICASRISLIFSRQEGSCVAVAESMMGGTPVGVFRNARVGSRAFINSRTGLLLEDRGLARQILRFIDACDRFDARTWAIESISCQVSTRRLNQTLRTGAQQAGRRWTRDIVTMYQNSVPLFAGLADARDMLDSYDDFRNRHGLAIAFPQRALIEANEGTASGALANT